jgi:hypothetical protein
MRTFTLPMRHLALLFALACGDESRARPLADAGSTPDPDAGTPLPDAGSPPDPDAGTPVPDAPPDGGPGLLKRVDWRAVRGAPVATSTVTVSSTALFALSSDGFVTQSDCPNALGCTYTWHDLAGTPGVRRDQLSRVTATTVSSDGTRAVLVATDEVELCTDARGETPVWRGKLQLLDLATGDARFELPLRSNVWSATGFTPLTDWFFAAPIEGSACLASTTGLRSATSPFGTPPGLAEIDQFVRFVDARRWLTIRNGSNLGLADPLAPGSFQFLAEDPSRFDVTQGWVHVYLGFGNLAEEVASVPPAGPMRQTTLRDDDWFAAGSLGRWVRVCGLPKPSPDDYYNCRVVDARGEVAAVEFRVASPLIRFDDTVLLGHGAAVFVGPTDDGSRAVQRIVFATGQRDILHRGDGALRPLGDGAAALLLQDGSAWLIEAEREELVAAQVTHVVSAPQIPLLARIAGHQDDVALLVSSSGKGRSTLAILDVRTRRLATVTDSLYFSQAPGAPFSFNDGCGQPWTTRNGGTVPEGLIQRPQHLFFVEEGTPAILWLLPIDLSAPPRRLAELAGDPAACHAPLTSPDGLRIGFAENGADGTTTRITLSSGP